MTTAGIIIILAYIVGIGIAFSVYRKREWSTFNKVWWSVFWLPRLICWIAYLLVNARSV